MSASEELGRAYRERDRAALEWRAQGGQVVGCLGSDVPEELLIAAGLLPVRVCGDPEAGLQAADLYMERAFDPRVRSRFLRIIDGSYSYLDHLVVSNSSDALVRAFYYLRALRMADPSLPVPDLYFFDLLHTRSRTSRQYNRGRAHDLKGVIEQWCEREIADEDLVKAIDICEENRRLLRELSDLRAPGPPRVSGVQALEVIGASMSMPRHEHNRLVAAFLQEAALNDPLPGVRLFVTGSAQDHVQFYELVESCGAVVVGEDHDWGARHAVGTTQITADPIDGVVARYHLRPPSAHQSTVSERVAALLENVHNTGAQGVIAFIYEADDAPSWDFPAQREALESEGIPVLLFDRQPYKLAHRDELQRRVRAFVMDIAQHDVSDRDVGREGASDE
jgi:benzoyl-CoA reductase/2-hydroxyglutaryl-CoA dehydratase subunit BcrC/BadD/HgdB